MEMLGWRLCYGSSTSYLMTWLWIPHASSWSSTYECVGLLRTFHPLLTSRFTFQHLPTFVFCLLCVLVWFFCFCCLLCFWFLFCKCLGIPNSPRSLDLDDRQGLIARSAMQQKKKNGEKELVRKVCFLERRVWLVLVFRDTGRTSFYLT